MRGACLAAASSHAPRSGPTPVPGRTPSDGVFYPEGIFYTDGMTESTDGNVPAEHAPDPGAHAPAPHEGDEAPRDWERTAARVGGVLGRFAQRTAQQAAQRAKAAAEAARPHVERTGRDALRYARDHEDEIKRVARVGAGLTARRVVPMPLVPIVDAMQAEALRRPAPLRDDRAAELRAEGHPPDDAPATGA